ncbi:MAG: hypothetical protein LBK46_03115, partial [Oscillospiraceae bacterium]|nr:hypothetical protein [Oscillospiraceae bacterium]
RALKKSFDLADNHNMCRHFYVAAQDVAELFSKLRLFQCPLGGKGGVPQRIVLVISDKIEALTPAPRQ